MSYTRAQMISQALTPKPSALLSVLGSTAMLFEIRASSRKASPSSQSSRSIVGNSSRRSSSNVGARGQNRAVNRLLAGMCLSDLLFSSGWFLTTWPSPKENADWLWGASGNTRTCSAQAFFISVGFWGTPLYNTVVSLYYRAIIEWGWSDDRLLKYDRWVHGAIWSAVTIRCVFYLAYEFFNAYGVICYVTSLPADCEGDECIRGNENTWKVGIFDQLFPIWPCLGLNTYFMAQIYLSVRKVARRSMNLHSINPSAEGLHQRLDDIKVQALLYVLAMFFCLVPDQIYALIYFLSPGRTYFNFWFETFAYIALPLQGYLNFIVYMRRQRKAHSRFGRFMIAPFRRCIVRRQRKVPTDRTGRTVRFALEENAVVDMRSEEVNDGVAVEENGVSSGDDVLDGKRESIDVVVEVDGAKSDTTLGENEASSDAVPQTDELEGSSVLDVRERVV